MRPATATGGVTEARRVVLEVLRRSGRGQRLDRAFGVAAAGLPDRERAFARELSYGVTRLRGRLDHLLERRVTGGLGRLDDVVLEVLRSGAYQLLYMSGVPDYAAVSQAVEQARNLAGPGAARLVNAVLRGVAADGDDPAHFPPFTGDPLGHLQTWGSHPRWLLERWLGRWPAETVRRLVEANNRAPPTFLVPLRSGVDEAIRILAEAGVGAHPVDGHPGCVRLAPGTEPRRALDALPSVIQDPAANLVARYADPDPGMKLADLCAAPGGKALALAEGAAYTLAADRSEPRVGLLKENADRVGSRIGPVVADALHPPLRAVDAVLLDVPCTGTGTLRRHPDGRWRLTPATVGEMSAIQGRLLEAAAAVVRPGGLLVYATCSLEPEENGERVEAFLDRHPDFAVEATGAVEAPFLDDDGRLAVLPQETGFDGAFAARLRRLA